MASSQPPFPPDCPKIDPWVAQGWSCRDSFRFFGDTKFRPHFWHVIFRIFHHFRSPRGSIFAPFSIILASLFRVWNLYRFYIDFGDGFWPHFRWLLDEFPVRALTSYETSRSLFLNNSMVFCAQNPGFILSEKTWIFIIFMIFSDTSFGIDLWWVFASMLAPFWEPLDAIFHVFGRSIF